MCLVYNIIMFEMWLYNEYNVREITRDDKVNGKVRVWLKMQLEERIYNNIICAMQFIYIVLYSLFQSLLVVHIKSQCNIHYRFYFNVNAYGVSK